MLIGINYEVIKSVNISLVFDDNRVKKQEISVGDIVIVAYNKNGMRKTIEGKVTRIYTDNNHHGHHVINGHLNSCGECKNEGCYIIVDGSSDCNSEIVRIDVDMILDIDVLQKSSATGNVVSPMGEYNITSIRIACGELQVSKDFGKTWIPVCKIMDSNVVVDDENDQPLANKISALLPNCGCESIEDRTEAVENIIALFKEESEKQE